MSNSGNRQNDVAKDFLRVSRGYFDLGRDRPDFPHLTRVRRAVLQSLLIAGGLGGIAHADSPPDEKQEVRTEGAVSISAMSATRAHHR